ncbi:DUF523 domain-containing protein [Oceanidesulfovibrio marinus]
MIDRNGGTSMHPEALEARLFALPGPIAVSACLAGMPTRYDGTDRAHPLVARLIAAGKALPLCPEQIGGLPTPRKPYEIRNGVVIAQDGDDVTEAFQRGARSAVKLCLQAKVRAAVLQPRSPSCGCDMVYDGSFGGVLVPGHGVFAGMLLDAGIQVLNAAVFDTEA